MFLWQKNLRDQPKIVKVDHQNIGLSPKMPEKDERPENDLLLDGSILQTDDWKWFALYLDDKCVDLLAEKSRR